MGSGKMSTLKFLIPNGHHGVPECWPGSEKRSTYIFLGALIKFFDSSTPSIEKVNYGEIKAEKKTGKK